jgi:hypothetical protein
MKGLMSIDLGLPTLPPPTLAPRRKSRQIRVGKVAVGGDAPISVQSMTTTLTADINATLQQIAELTATGCDIVRVAVPSQDDADALPVIARKSQIPVIADIHFQPRYVFAAIDAGCAGVRVNPGNIRAFDDQVMEISRPLLTLDALSGSGSTPDHWTSASSPSTARQLPRHWRSQPCGKQACLRSTISETSKSRSSTATQSSWCARTSS